MTEQFERACQVYEAAHEQYVALCERLESRRGELAELEKLVENKKDECDAAWRVVASMIGW